MPSVTISRPDVFPNGTVVGIYPPGSKQSGQIPTAAAITTGTVTAETVTVTNAGILRGVDYESRTWAAARGPGRRRAAHRS
jgi:hypothetical protein